MSATRYRRGALEAATDIYRRGDRTIALMGVCHVSDKSFWTAMNARIAGYESMGFQVHYEAVRNEKSVALGNLDYPFIAEIFGLQDQRSGLHYQDYWTNTDADLSDILTRSPQFRETLAQMEALLTKFRELRSEAPEQLAKVARICRGIMPVAISVLPRILGMIPGSGGVDKSVILGYRNSIALEAMLSAEGDVLAIWGADHLQGLGEGLRSEGFRHESRVWTRSIGPVPATEPVACAA